MTDHRNPDGDHNLDNDRPDDERDPQLAGLLAVEPLDELTRRRLVRRALDEPVAAPGAPIAQPVEGTGPGRRGPNPSRRVWWAGAAAAVVAAVVVTALALGGGGSGDHTTAAPATTIRPGGAASGTEPAAAPAPNADSATGQAKTAAPPTTAGIADLGDLGKVDGDSTLRARVDAARRSLRTAAPGFSPESPGTSNPEATTGSGAFPCAAAFAAAQPDLGPPEAVGTGTVRGKPVTVVVAPLPSGTAVAVVVVDAGCKVQDPVFLTTSP